MDRFNLHDKVPVVTGGSKGIGRAIALAFANTEKPLFGVFWKRRRAAEKAQKGCGGPVLTCAVSPIPRLILNSGGMKLNKPR